MSENLLRRGDKLVNTANEKSRSTEAEEGNISFTIWVLIIVYSVVSECFKLIRILLKYYHFHVPKKNQLLHIFEFKKMRIICNKTVDTNKS